MGIEAMTKDIKIGLSKIKTVLKEAGLRAKNQASEPRLFYVLDRGFYQRASGETRLEALEISEENSFFIEEGEQNKSLETARAIWEALLKGDYEKNDILLAIGGGRTGDIAAFAASCYKRGMKLVHVPTTLLAMVDSSIGGKTGLNLDSIKNALGSYYEAELRLLDYSLLNYLPKEELLCGLAEMIKIAAVYDEKMFRDLEEKKFSSVFEKELIIRAMELKKDIVAKDPFEKNLRKILNFGHTVGHALEAYQLDKKGAEIKHGYAIALGMIEEVRLGLKKGLVNPEAAKRLTKLIEDCGFEIDFEADYDALLPYLRNDKKKEDGSLIFALMTEIGRADLVYLSEEEVVNSVW